jgi:uncharacterized low-complexity protein
MMRSMRACSTVNTTLGIAFVLAFAFAGCSGQKPAPATPASAASAAAPDAKPAATDDKAGDDKAGDDKNGDDGDDKAGDDKAGDDKAGDEPEKRTTEVIQGIVQDNRKAIRACYDKARKQLPDLAGQMTIHFVLDPEGKLKKAELNQERSSLKSPEVVKCAIDALKKIKFPPSSRGMESTINYPFNFKPDGGGGK